MQGLGPLRYGLDFCHLLSAQKWLFPQRGKLANMQEKVIQTFKRMSWILFLHLSSKAPFCKYIWHLWKRVKRQGNVIFLNCLFSGTSSLCLSEKMVVFVKGVFAVLRTGTSIGTHFLSLWGLSYFHRGPRLTLGHQNFIANVLKCTCLLWWNAKRKHCHVFLAYQLASLYCQSWETEVRNWSALWVLFMCLWRAWCVCMWVGRAEFDIRHLALLLPILFSCNFLN